jgi:hypothetical protein
MPASMTFKRLLACAVASAFLIAAAPAAAQDLGGGAAMTPAEPAPAAAADPAAPPLEAAPAQTTPTTPEGEEQPPQEQPDGEQPPTSEPTPEAAPEAGVGGESTGGLPQTGWQAFALASIGLGLLLAGAALWPTSSWPPPRDRLSRSLTRR